jgi:signal transduction histidine kinase
VYTVFPLLIWAALRFGRRGATLAVAITVAVTVWNTTHYLGPFHVSPLSRSVLDAQLFIGVAAVSTLVLAAMVSERERFVRELAASRGRLIEAAHAERRRLEHNLHDGAQQRLVWLAGDLRRAVSLTREHPDRAPGVLESAEAEVTVALDELRDLAHGIHPAVLTDLGLRAALTEMAIRSRLPIVVGELPPERLDERAETTAYYVFAEAVTNAQKHSHASSVHLSGVVRGGTLRIEITDDGVGGASPSGTGIVGLRDRVEGVGGRFALESPPGRGTLVTARIPVGTRSD